MYNIYRFKKPYSLWYNSKISEQFEVCEIVKDCLKNYAFQSIESPTIFIQKERLIKSNAEIELLRKSCQIASDAINKTIQNTKPGSTFKCHRNNISKIMPFKFCR